MYRKHDHTKNAFLPTQIAAGASQPTTVNKRHQAEINPQRYRSQHKYRHTISLTAHHGRRCLTSQRTPDESVPMVIDRTGAAPAAYRDAGHETVIKPKPLRPAVPGRFTLDDFTVDEPASGRSRSLALRHGSV